MAAFIPTIPNAGDFLDATSQPQLRNNNLALDARFGVDHYKYSDATGQSGKHNRVTTPIFITQPVPNGQPPVIIATEPVIAAFRQTALVGVLQYSYGWSVANAAQAVPTPITSLHSQSTGITLAVNATTDLLDFTGLTRAIVNVFGSSFTDPASLTLGLTIISPVFWNGSAFNTLPVIPNRLQLTSAGNILQIVNRTTNPLTNVFWTMQMIRMQ